MSRFRKNNWRHVQLGSLAEFRNGVNFSNENFGRGIKVIGVSDFQNNVRATFDHLDEINPEGVVRPQHLLRNDDILFVRSNGNRDLIGRSMFVDGVPGEITHSAFSIRLRFTSPECNPRFYSYLFRSQLIRQALSLYGGGTNISNLNQDILARLQVPVPPLATQGHIAGVLAAYDDLIDNNTRRITIVEQMVQMLYREWFVNFRFPGYEKVKMVEAKIGLIPNGWEVSGIGEVTTKIGSGATPRGGKKSYQTSGISLIRSLNVYDYKFEMDDLAFIDDEQAQQLDNVTVELKDVLLNITGASVGRCAMVPSYILPARVNQHVAIIRANPTKIDPFFLLDTINHNRNKRTLLGIAQGGATREALTKERITEFRILLPPFELIRQYGEIARHLHEQREKLSRKNEVLRFTRDLLLPKLMSGEISVEETVVSAQTV